jgi:hypothetical protein
LNEFHALVYVSYREIIGIVERMKLNESVLGLRIYKALRKGFDDLENF